MPKENAVSKNGVPPHIYFLISAIFHYLGPSFAVLLFSSISVLGVAWFRIATAAGFFMIWRRPWHRFFQLTWDQQRIVIGLGIVLGLMNASFYIAIARIPLGTVAAIEFLGPIILAALGVRNLRNVVALLFAAIGVWLLTDVRLEGDPLGFIFAFSNCIFFIIYIMLGHRVASDGGSSGIDRLSIAMVVALFTVTPIGINGALPAITSPILLLAALGVGVCSSVIPYVCDQLAMAKLSRSTFSILLSILPVTATLIGILVLHQFPTILEIIGIFLVASGVLLHQTKET
ncbi:EamA family transporter [Staphylococcus xylosus]|uniref:EamA family transporter n=1 Tax=Staphylococcaceae TaxID=90964 RepID=UPI000D1D55F3|nr:MULTISPECIES: EamA family transporter [Bacillales]MEB5686944.1 EamA family transporter [Mammaliicoccus lentus]PTI44385.1 EamA family transporter [Staphylococcus xylosus]HLR69277.1 EamA family transporter [Virgibacillus sp.]